MGCSSGGRGRAGVWSLWAWLCWGVVTVAVAVLGCGRCGRGCEGVWSLWAWP